MFQPARHMNLAALEALEAVHEHRPVDLAQHVEPDLDAQVQSIQYDGGRLRCGRGHVPLP